MSEHQPIPGTPAQQHAIRLLEIELMREEQTGPGPGTGTETETGMDTVTDMGTDMGTGPGPGTGTGTGTGTNLTKGTKQNGHTNWNDTAESALTTTPKRYE